MTQNLPDSVAASSDPDIGSLLAQIESIATAAPSVQVLEQAAEAAYTPSSAASLGLRVMLDTAGQPMTIATASGVNATAFIDNSGNVIIAYQGTTTGGQFQLDAGIAGNDGSAPAGFSDALSFARHVQTVAAREGILPTQIYVTGHSLGGTLSSYVASETGLPGASFAASGIPGYQAPATPAANFINYVDKGDPFANYGTDTAEKGSAAVAIPAFDHYGTVVLLGSAADAAALAPFAAAINGYSLVQLEAGATPAQVTSLTNAFDGLMGTYHGLAGYASAVNATSVPGSAYGLQTVPLSTILATVASDMPKLLADVPALFQASSYAAALQIFQVEFPILSAELTSVVHASSFAAAFNDMVADLPSLAADITNPAKLGSLLAAIASDLTVTQPTSLSGGASLVGHVAAALSTAHASAVSHVHA